MMNRLQKILPGTCVILTILIIVHFITLVTRHAVNLPIWDDFDSILWFMNLYNDAPTVSEKLLLVYKQHNEHRIIVNKVLSLLDYWVFSEVNFAHLIYASSAALIALAVILGSKSKEILVTILISCAVLLQPQYGDGLNWVTTSVASFFLTLFALLCSFLAYQSKIKYYYLLPLTALACFSQGNGILVPYCIALYFLLEKRWFPAFCIFLFGALTCYLYFLGYTTPQHTQNISELYGNIPHLLDYGFTIVGASLGFSNKIASLSCGVVLTLLFLFVLSIPKLRKNSPLIPFLLFLFLSAAINTAARGMSSTDFAISPGRYTILSSGIVAALAIIFFQYLSLRESVLRYIFIPAALVFNFYSYHYYFNAVENLYVKTINDLAGHALTDMGLTYPWPDRGVPLYRESEAKGIYSLPYAELGLQERTTLDSSGFLTVKNNMRLNINRVQSGKEHFVIEGWAFIKSCSSNDTDTFINLVSASETIAIKALKKPRTDVEGHFKSNKYHNSGYISVFPKTWLKTGEKYNYQVVMICGELKYKQKTRYMISTEVVDLKLD